MHSIKPYQIVLSIVLILIGGGLFILLKNYESQERIKLICKKWVYHKETLWDKMNELNKLKYSNDSFEQIAGLYGNQLLKFANTSTFEFKNNGNYIIGNSEKGLSVFLTQVGNWECNFWGTKLYLTLNDKTVIYEIEELTESSLKLTHKEGHEEIIEKFVPFIVENENKKKESTNSKSRQEEIVNENFKPQEEYSELGKNTTFLDYPTEVNYGENIYVNLRTPHYKEFGIIDPLNNFFYVVYSGDDNFFQSSIDSKSFENLKTIVINTSTFKGTKIEGDGPELIFNKEGIYKFIIGDNLESESITETLSIKVKK